jgi:hypothetical protein
MLPVALSTPTLLPSPFATTAPAKPILLVGKVISDTNTKLAYSFTVNYPQIEGASAQNLVAFNQTAEKMAQELLASYQNNSNNAKATPDPSFGSSFMEAKYQVIHGTDGLLTILFSVSEYWAGAAHPFSYSLVLNFNLQTGKTIVLKELFKQSVNYLQVIGDYCSADLKKRDRLEFPEGVLPKAENFQNWTIADQGVIIYFDPYQVAPYALGPSQVTIPFEALKASADPAGPLGIYLK